MELEKYISSREIKSLKPLLEKWIFVMKKYLNFCNWEDCQWWYTEPASISSLAAAAWEIGGIAIEEYSVGKGKKSKGRCDLYIDISNQQFACEGKQVWTAIGRKSSQNFNDIKSGLKSACDDARKLKKKEGRRLGLCFVVPYFPPSDEKYIDDCLDRWLRKIRTLNYSSVAWFFPIKARKIQGDDNYFYPGVVLIVKEVHRSIYSG